MPGLTAPLSASTVPFPGDVPTHPLLVIDHSLIQAHDPEELDRLWEAATQLGFWYLKNHGLDEEVARMFDVCAEAMDLPLEEKMRFEIGDDGNLFGYKARGTIATDKNGTRDNVEFLDIAQDDAFSWPVVTHRTYPSVVTTHMADTFTPFMRKSAAVNAIFLTVFETRLGLPAGTFAALHDPARPNGGEARCIRTPPHQNSAGVGAHTDFGSLAIVNNRLGGLQVMPPGTDQWLYIKPVPGYAICNIGDTLAIFSAGILRSNVHRVMPPPGAQSQFPRYSVSFFTRPGSDIRLRALCEESSLIAEAAAKAPEGLYDPGVTAREWLMRRVRNLRRKNREGWLDSQGTEHEGAKGH
ncbi:Clavaminate synthase-like protein [Phanerochaete sordida]|uniref:Clavaminate synthase-like protein n=1 Tax=Phanerochaete sordida TaxID=48140 RepID=A0A9P3G740_9APHY|nr:Clavaminate synthase-like protein [Phanerochaete sordida]